jgi:capsular polysaccharide biosynthesis protein
MPGKSKRSIANEQDLIIPLRSLAASHGYDFQVANHNGHRSQREQISLFNSAIVVVGMHGGSFSNIGYCKDGTIIIELNAETGRRDCFASIALGNSLKYFRYPLPGFHYDSFVYTLTLEDIKNIIQLITSQLNEAEVVEAPRD